MKAEGHPPTSEYRVQARYLLSQLRCTDSEETVNKAAAKFRRLRSFSENTVDQIVRKAKLKHALTLVALEAGHESWRALKESTQAENPPMYAGGMDAFLSCFGWIRPGPMNAIAGTPSAAECEMVAQLLEAKKEQSESRETSRVTYSSKNDTERG